MSIRRQSNWLSPLIGLACGVAGLSANQLALGNIDLELRPLDQTAGVGDTVGLGLYVVSDDPETIQALASMHVMVGWDPAVLQLLGLDDTGAVSLLSSVFPADDPFNVNEAIPPQDGDAFYLAFAQLGNPVQATPQGTLITTFLFAALGPTSVTTVQILESAGDPAGDTVVFDGTVPNLAVTGLLGSAEITVLVPCPADVNQDGAVDVLDLVEVVLAWGPCPEPPEPCNADVNTDGAVDVLDLVEVVLAWGPCS